jgi:hypothetical protein
MLAEELQAPDVLARLSDPLDPSASVRYALGKTLTVLSSSQRVRFGVLGLPEGSDWPLPVIERMADEVPLNAVTPEGMLPRLATSADLEALVAFSLVRLVPPEEAT